MAELADAYDSGSYGSIPLRVQVPLSAPDVRKQIKTIKTYEV